MEQRDAAAFGSLLVASHASLRDRLHVSSAALDRLVDAAMDSGALGARLTGAGFGGCVVALLPRGKPGRRAAPMRLDSALLCGVAGDSTSGMHLIRCRRARPGALQGWSIQGPKCYLLKPCICNCRLGDRRRLHPAICFVPALFFGKRSGKSTAEFFASGRSVPWWLAGLSMVATTFSSDTPNLVANFVRTQGVAGNWQWWAFTLTGVATVFFYARLWRRSGVLTDLEFYELRYSGKAASAVRGFRAVYLGLLFNCMIMATVNLAAVQNRRGAVRLRPLADAARRGLAERGLRRALRPVGRAGHRHDAVLHQDVGGDRGGLFRRGTAAGGRHARAGGEALAHARAGRPELPEHAAGFHQQLGPGRGRLHHPHHRAVVGGLVSGRGTRRRQLHCAAHAGVEIGERRAGRYAVLQRGALRSAAVAVDSGRPRFADRVSATVRHPERSSQSRSETDRARYRLLRPCCASCPWVGWA